MRPADLELLPALSAPAVHPSGGWAVVAASYPSFAADAATGQLWRVELDGSRPPRRITRGFRDSSPAFSPDGALLAFLRSAPDAKPQLFVAPAEGGEAAQATDERLGVEGFAWASEGRLAYLARVPEDGRYGTLKGVGPAAEGPRRLTTLQIRANGLGWTGDRRAHLFVVDAPDPAGEVAVAPVGRAARGLPPDAPRPGVPLPTRLSSGDVDHSAPAAGPGGSVLAASARHAGRDADLFTEVFRFTDPDADPTPVAPGLNAYEAALSADGATVFCLGADLGDSRRDFVGKLGGLFAVPAEGGPARRLTDEQSVQVEHGLGRFGADGVLATWNDRGTLRPLTARPGGVVSRWPSGEASVLAAAEIPGRADRIAVVVATPERPAELATLDADGTLRVLTDFSGRLAAAGPVAAPRELTASAPDGHPVHGWVYLPEGPGPHPVLLCLHGGPHSAYSPAFFDEFQVYAGAGYAVVACNPRGSGGYGLEHGRAVKDRLGGPDADDVLAFLDHALAVAPGLDAARVGVMGGSYGGFLTAWLIGHTDRFAAAIVERGYLDPHSFVGASDIGWFFIAEYSGPPSAWDAQSPMAIADRVRTPTLVLHSEDDLRCPLGPALGYYTRLKQNGVDAELLVFPGENHELSRSGTPHHRRQRFEAILDWWGRHLPVADAPEPADAPDGRGPAGA